MRRFAVLVPMIALLVGCAPAPPAQSTTGSQAPAAERKAANQSLTIAKVGLPGAVTPESSSANMDIMYAVFDTLLNFEADFKLVPAVAEKWEFRPEKKAWHFTIRQDLTFGNGQKLTAADVVYSINLIPQKNLPVRSYLTSVTRAEKVDATTVAVFTEPVDYTMLDGTPFIAIFPEAYHKEAGKDFGVKPIGTGRVHHKGVRGSLPELKY